WATLAGSAHPGVDYGTVGSANELSGTLDFADGQTTATFTVPILGSAASIADRSFSIVLSNAVAATPGVDAFPTGNAVTTVTISNIDLAAPAVTGVHLDGGRGSIKTITVDFSKALMQAPAE